MENNQPEINVVDSFLTQREFERVVDYCHNARYTHGEVDQEGSPTTGMVHEIPETEFVYKLLRKTVFDRFPDVEKLKLYRMYVNCFAPREIPYFHTDGDDGYTFLYYVNESWQPNDGGETQFLMDDSLHGVVPIPNRMVMFDASILHRATSFRDTHRFTVAIKYQ